MKRIITTFALFLSLTAAYAQDDKRGFIGIGIGPSVPFSDFASTNQDNDDAGYALTGGHLNLSFGYLIGAHLGIAASLTGTSNSVDESALEADFRDEYPGANWNIDADRWRLGALLVGGLASFPASDNLDVDFKVMIGALSFTSPEVRATASSGPLNYSARREEKTVTTGAFDIGAGIRYRVANSIALMANADFISANPRFEDVTTTTSFGSSSSTYDYHYNALNITLGIGFLLN